MDRHKLIENLSKLRMSLASAQSTDVECETLDKKTVQKLYWGIEDAMTAVKILQESVGVE